MSEIKKIEEEIKKVEKVLFNSDLDPTQRMNLVNEISRLRAQLYIAEWNAMSEDEIETKLDKLAENIAKG